MFLLAYNGQFSYSYNPNGILNSLIINATVLKSLVLIRTIPLQSRLNYFIPYVLITRKLHNYFLQSTLD